MSIEFGDEEDVFDTALLNRMRAKHAEYAARSDGYKQNGDNHNARAYKYIALGFQRAINMYEADLQGFSDTLPTGMGDLPK